jgi:hypothetical protein
MASVQALEIGSLRQAHLHLIFRQLAIGSPQQLAAILNLLRSCDYKLELIIHVEVNVPGMKTSTSPSAPFRQCICKTLFAADSM